MELKSIDKRGKRVFTGLVLAILTIALFSPLAMCDFINFDDDHYVYNNAFVREGMTWQGVREAFTTYACANWHPLTWLSLMLDAQLFGADNAGAFHFVNVLIHAANAALLFLALAHMTGRSGPSALVALLFAVHPLHVESVAWVSERKDVLSTFFWMLVLWSYSHYARHPTRIAYAGVLVFFVLGLLAKPMLVTLPCVLLLCDFWPLARWSQFPSGKTALARLFVEKIPLFMLSAACCVMTVIAQRSEGAVGGLEDYPLFARFGNALAGYVFYLGKTIWPTGLAIFYPYSANQWSPIMLTAAGALLLAISVAAIAMARTRPALLFGWLWYLGTLIPVIGLVQVGKQSVADRYTYVPLIGVFIMLAFGSSMEWLARGMPRFALKGAMALVTGLLMLVTSRQIVHWRDNGTLFQHALAVTEDNWLAHLNLGVALEGVKRSEEALEQYQQAVRIRPQSQIAQLRLGIALNRRGNFNDAETHLRAAVNLKPEFVAPRVELASVLTRLGKIDAAISECRQALQYAPGSFGAHAGLGILLAKQQQTDAAIYHCRAALRIHPDDAALQQQLQQLLAHESPPSSSG